MRLVLFLYVWYVRVFFLLLNLSVRKRWRCVVDEKGSLYKSGGRRDSEGDEWKQLKQLRKKQDITRCEHKYVFKASLFKASYHQTATQFSSSSFSSWIPQSICAMFVATSATLFLVGVPLKRIMETVTVKCGHCSNISFLTSRPIMPTNLPDFHMTLGLQTSCHDFRKGQPSSPTSSVENLAEMTPKVHHVVKPPERKHRVPSAYNRFMKEEIQRIKTAQPNIPHREAFSMAAKNWAKSDTNAPNGSQKSPKAAAAISLHV
ncbi:Protein DROOPING LEAF [Zostera marina]|uniref:Protein DROOPING LEAF n=1 Tax=Zostera marina TaxID=29655 RepID=A0A0K9PN40_ZOSMR|nr:Protein DROOPING LEAF [Zostera marina]